MLELATIRDFPIRKSSFISDECLLTALEDKIAIQEENAGLHLFQLTVLKSIT